MTWRIDTHSDPGSVYIMGLEASLPELAAWSPVAVVHGHNSNVKNARARMIVCAPEMLDALREAIVAIGAASLGQPTHETVERIQQVIAKATRI